MVGGNPDPPHRGDQFYTLFLFFSKLENFSPTLLATALFSRNFPVGYSAIL